MDESFQSSRCTFTFQLKTYGVRRWRSTPRMSQGETEQSIVVVLKIGPAGDQLRVPPDTLVELARIFPPEGETPTAPVGITFKPAVDALFTPFCPRKMARWGIS